MLIKNEKIKEIIAYISLVLLVLIIITLVIFGVIKKNKDIINNNIENNTITKTNEYYKMDINITNDIETYNFYSIIDITNNKYIYYELNDEEKDISTNIDIYLLFKSLINTNLNNYKLDINLNSYLLNNLKEYFSILGYEIIDNELYISIEGNKLNDKDSFKVNFTSNNTTYNLTFNPITNTIKEVQ